MGSFITEGIPALNGTGQRRPPDWQKIWKRDEWNSMRIRMVGEVPEGRIWMNDVQIVDYQDDKNHALGGVYLPGMIADSDSYHERHHARAIPNGVHRYRNIASGAD